MAEFECEILADWAGGDCVFRMSVPVNGSPPSPRPRITGDLILIVDRFRADGRRQPHHIRVILPIPLLDMAQLTSARIDVVHDAVVEAWSRNQFHGSLSEALILVLADKLSRFFRYVAGEMGAAPDITYVSAVGRVRLFNAEGGEDAAEEEGDVEVVAIQEEMGGEGEGEEGDHQGDGEEAEMGGEEGVLEEEEEGAEEMGGEEGVLEVEEEEEEGEEETRCAICLGRMASTAEGRWERWWLPCCHCFHRGCLQRWLQHKAECPLCRAPAGASAGGRVHMVRISSDPNFFTPEEDQSGGSTALMTQKKDEFIVSSCIFGDPCIISNLVCFLLL